MLTYKNQFPNYAHPNNLKYDSYACIYVRDSVPHTYDFWMYFSGLDSCVFLVRQVQFEVADATKRVYPDNYFDVVYSRDTILHIKDKLDLFQRFYVSDRNCEKPWCNMLDLKSNTSLNFALVQCSNGFVFFFLQRCLKPGGRLLISDYACSPDEHSEQFKAYVKQRGYNLLSPEQYGKVMIWRNKTIREFNNFQYIYIWFKQLELQRIGTFFTV